MLSELSTDVLDGLKASSNLSLAHVKEIILNIFDVLTKTETEHHFLGKKNNMHVLYSVCLLMYGVCIYVYS